MKRGGRGQGLHTFEVERGNAAPITYKTLNYRGKHALILIPSVEYNIRLSLHMGAVCCTIIGMMSAGRKPKLPGSHTREHASIRAREGERKGKGKGGGLKVMFR